MNFLQDAKYSLLAMVLTISANVACAQRTQSQPVNDSAAQASPLAPALNAPATDSSEQASPVDEAHRSHGLPGRTTVRVVLNEGIDSGSLKNGQLVHGKVVGSATSQPRVSGAQPGKASVVKAGTPVALSVIATVPAGKLNSVGELSLELVRIGGQAVFTDVQTFRGKPGSRDLPDSAPTVGTNAGLPAGTELTFTIQPEPGFASSAPQPIKPVPGSVTGVASGSKPANFGQPAASAAKGSNAGNAQGGTSTTAAANGTPQPAQHAGQVGTTPNQPTAPTNASPTTTTQPH